MVRNNCIVLSLTVFFLFIIPFTVKAQVLTFEDLYPGYETCCDSIPEGYGGFTWSEWAMWTTSENDVNSGYNYGTIGRVSLFTGAAEDISMSSSENFNFYGAYIAAAWTIGQDVTVEGWRDGSLIYTETITTSYDQPYWFDFNYMNIQTIWFRPGDEGTFGVGRNHHIAIDNITVSNSIVPEPISSTLFIVGGATLGFRRFRKKFKK